MSMVIVLILCFLFPKKKKNFMNITIFSLNMVLRYSIIFHGNGKSKKIYIYIYLFVKSRAHVTSCTKVLESCSC